MADISFNITCKELKIAQIAQLNQLCQLLHLVCIYGHGFCEFSRMVMRKNINGNEVSKDSPIGVRFREVFLERDLTVRPGLRTRFLYKNQTKKGEIDGFPSPRCNANLLEVN